MSIVIKMILFETRTRIELFTQYKQVKKDVFERFIHKNKD